MLALTQNYTAIGANMVASFLASGGTKPYVYSVQAGGAGGTINSSTGLYTAPATASSDPTHSYDTIHITDALSATATASILVGTPLLLFCDVIQTGMSLTSDRMWLFDQKIFQPSDYDLYIAVSVPICKPFGNVNQTVATKTGMNEVQTVNMMATIDIDAISRGPAARDRKEEIILSLNSVYAEQQMEANSFYFGKLPPGSQFINLSNIDGAAIPYRYKISIQMQYAFTKTQAIPYFDTFGGYAVTTNP